MGRTGWVYDDRFLRHETGHGHPERPDRLRAIRDKMAARGLLDRVTPLTFGPAPLSIVEAPHCADSTHRLHEACEHHARYIDNPDSAICPASHDIALLAVGGVLAACDAVMTGVCDNAFCAIRPPGHHAEHNLSMGFCLFNNVGIAARHLRKNYGLKRIAILDWDVHHGNGTQHSFEEDPGVFFCSIHEHPQFCYPGTGWPDETGVGAGEGTTLNLAMMPGAKDGDYRQAFETAILPAIGRFNSEFILISAGFDAHKDDPLAGVELSDEAYIWIAQKQLELAKTCCGGRLVCVLEGGYHLEALSNGVANVVSVLLEA